MGYDAQLIVRSNDDEGTAIIEKVKALAGDRGKTYSKMALILLERALEDDSGPGVGSDGHEQPAAGGKADADRPAPAQSDRAPTSSTGGAGADPASKADTVTAGPSEPDANSASESESSVQPEAPAPPPDATYESAADVVEACMDHLEEYGAQSAAKTLAHFFSSADPIEGGKVKNKLKETVSSAEYDVILGKLRNTDEYRQYRQRVIFER